MGRRWPVALDRIEHPARPRIGLGDLIVARNDRESLGLNDIVVATRRTRHVI